MKKIITIISFLIVLPGLVACGSVANASTATQASSSLLSTGYDNALSVPTQLAIGTFKLESTANKIDAKTAKDLLPLWKAVRSLSSDTTAAPQELQALYKQIEETMLPEQVTAISALHLTRADMAQVAQAMGMNFGGGGGGSGNFTPEQRATAQAARQSGQGFPGGGGGFGGGGFPGGGGNNNQQGTQTTNRTQSSSSGSSQGVNPLLLDAIIKLLQAKVQ